MFTTEINGFENAPITFDSANNSVHINKNALAVSGISESTSGPAHIHDNTYIVDGWLQNGGSAIKIVGDRDIVSVGETGHVSSIYGAIFLSGDANRITNSGEIVGGLGSAGILVSAGTGTHIQNDGLITGDGGGVDFDGDKGLVVNGKDGVITGNNYALRANTGSGTTFINHGLLIGSRGTAFQSGTATPTLINDGTIKGDVSFGDGGGTFDNRGGIIQGAIIGGAGSDTLITDSAKYHLTEQADQSIDTVKSTVSYTLNDNVDALTLIGKADINGNGNAGENYLSGNVGDNILSGAQGVDHLSGGKGNDHLVGGDGRDYFIFNTGWGHDIIEDYDANDDAVMVGGWRAIGNMDDIMAHAHGDHGNTVIEAGSDSLTLKGIHLADLDTVLFIFPN